jgi:hypothetical protein
MHPRPQRREVHCRAGAANLSARSGRHPGVVRHNGGTAGPQTSATDRRARSRGRFQEHRSGCNLDTADAYHGRGNSHKLGNVGSGLALQIRQGHEVLTGLLHGLRHFGRHDGTAEDGHCSDTVDDGADSETAIDRGCLPRSRWEPPYGAESRTSRDESPARSHTSYTLTQKWARVPRK